MPMPLSDTSTTTVSPSRRVATEIRPPSGIASTALKMRFSTTCVSSWTMPVTIGTWESAAWTSIRFPRASDSCFHLGREISMASLIARLMSTGAWGASLRIRV